MNIEQSPDLSGGNRMEASIQLMAELNEYPRVCGENKMVIQGGTPGALPPNFTRRLDDVKEKW